MAMISSLFSLFVSCKLKKIHPSLTHHISLMWEETAEEDGDLMDEDDGEDGNEEEGKEK